jgi:uncharacterized protein YdaL
MNLAQVDFQQLRIKHILYKSKVRSMLYGGTYDPTFFSATGPVSQWFTATGQIKYNREPELPALINVHQELNTAATQMHRLYTSGKIDEAHDGLKHIEKKSDQFLELLAQMEKRLAV